jgi:hypothetical protein
VIASTLGRRPSVPTELSRPRPPFVRNFEPRNDGSVEPPAVRNIDGASKRAVFRGFFSESSWPDGAPETTTVETTGPRYLGIPVKGIRAWPRATSLRSADSARWFSNP